MIRHQNINLTSEQVPFITFIYYSLKCNCADSKFPIKLKVIFPVYIVFVCFYIIDIQAVSTSSGTVINTIPSPCIFRNLWRLYKLPSSIFGWVNPPYITVFRAIAYVCDNPTKIKKSRSCCKRFAWKYFYAPFAWTLVHR